MTTPDKANGREALIHAGRMLSNCAFNLSFRNPGQFTARDIETLDECRRAWDKAQEDYRAASQAQRTETADDSSLIDRYTSALVAWRCDGGPFGPVEAAEKELRAALNRRTETEETVAEPDIPPGCEMARGWCVEVSVYGQNILTIEEQALSGVTNLVPWESTIRSCGEHLLSFIGASHPPASTAPDISPEDSASILDTYRKLHEGKIGAHWLWCVIEQIAAGVSEDEAMREYGFYSTAPVAGATGGEWLPIDTAPEGELVVVGWLDAEDKEHPERHEFDYREEGVWVRHEEDREHFCMVAPPESRGPGEKAPYTHWMKIPAIKPSKEENHGR